VILDERLLSALLNHRSSSDDVEWGRWQNALACFNRSNTDSDNIYHQVEWVLLSSAFEHILDAKPEAKHVATRFSQTMVPIESLLVRNASRRSTNWSDNGQTLRYEWMREFYRIRGDFAHGKLNTQQLTTWSPFEHLLLATIAFPLVVRCLLTKAARYQLTDDDRSQIGAFEKLVDTRDFSTPPSDQRNSLDSHWRRLCSDVKSRLAVQEAVKAFEARNFASQEKATPADDNSSSGQGA
jgi:hypothetical protein